MKTNTKKYALWAGLLLGSALGASAVPVTFQVNMDYQMTNATPTFTPPADTVEVKGNWDGWAGHALVNVPGTGWYTNTVEVAGTAGDTIQYKFHTYGTHDVWENFPGYIYTTGGNRTFVLAGSAQSLPQQFFNDVWGGTVPLTVQVDMLAPIIGGTFVPGSDTVELKGYFNGWAAGIALTNDPAGIAAPTNIYSMTLNISVPAPGGLCAYKFHTYGTHDVWEADPNRIAMVSMPETSWPLTCFNRACLPPIGVALALQVDMNSQIASRNFDPATDQVWADGDNFGGWGDPPQGLQMIEDTSRPGVYTNYWTGSMSPGARLSFKYKAWSTTALKGAWEGLSTNRFVAWTGSEPTDGAGNLLLNLPLSLFGFWQVNTNDYLTKDTWVTFTVDMTGAIGVPDNNPTYGGIDWNDGFPHSVYINGAFAIPSGTVPFSSKWWAWRQTPVDPVFGAFQLTNNPSGSPIYSLEVLLPKGSPVRVQYKYSIDGYDNGGGSGVDRFRDVRTEGLANYVFPTDTFNTQYVENIYDAHDFGRLAINAASGGTVPVQWLGRPGVHLQTTTDLAGGAWTDLYETDGTNWTAGVASPDGLVSVTNYPASAGATFFRLLKPGP